MIKRVLIVEDQTAVREMIAEIISSQPDFEVVAGLTRFAIEQGLISTPGRP